MTDEGFKIQASFKTRSNPNSQFASLLNVRADTPDELNENLDALIANLPKINQIEALLGAVETVNEAFAPQQQSITQAPSGQAYAPPAAPQSQPPAGPICLHGPMKWMEGISKKTNKPYKMWACTSSDYNNQCKPEFVR